MVARGRRWTCAWERSSHSRCDHGIMSECERGREPAFRMRSCAPLSDISDFLVRELMRRSATGMPALLLGTSAWRDGYWLDDWAAGSPLLVTLLKRFA